MEIAATSTVVQRNSIGRFISECEAAAGYTIGDLIDEGAEMSKSMAPVGGKVDPRTPTLRAAMFSQQLSRTSGIWGNFARHALPIETGAAPHEIVGNPALGFFWEGKGRHWIPASLYYHVPGLIDVVNHPGNAAQPYLRPAYEVMMAKAMSVAKRHYPS